MKLVREAKSKEIYGICNINWDRKREMVENCSLINSNLRLLLVSHCANIHNPHTGSAGGSCIDPYHMSKMSFVCGEYFLDIQYIKDPFMECDFFVVFKIEVCLS